MADRIAMIHQPHFLPWPPFFIRLLCTDVYIALDDVKYHKDYYHNRTALFDTNGNKFWFTLPVKKSTRNEYIKFVQLSKTDNAREFKNTITQRCRQLNSNKEIINCVLEIIDKNRLDLCNINIDIITFITNKIIEGTTLSCGILRSSEFIMNESLNRTDRLIFLCEAAQCNALIMGKDSRNCHELERLKKCGIQILEANNHDGTYDPEISILNELCVDSYKQNITKIMHLAEKDRIYYLGRLH